MTRNNVVKIVTEAHTSPAVDETDKRIIVATQAGLPLTAQPYHTVATRLGIPAEELMTRIRRMQENGIIRRIGVVPNHYALGYRANGMSVWDITDECITEIGRKIGALEFVSHCYQRPRHLPDWPYNLFAMVHGRTREDVAQQVARIADMLGEDNRAHNILFSTRILKKTGLRIGGGE